MGAKAMDAAAQNRKEKEDIAERRASAQEDAEDVRDEITEQTAGRVVRLRDAIQRRLNRRLDRIAQKANEKVIDLEKVLDTAMGSSRKRVIQRIDAIKTVRAGAQLRLRKR